jgi:hypothetical protein
MIHSLYFTTSCGSAITSFSVISYVYYIARPLESFSTFHFLRLVRALALARLNFTPPHRQPIDRSTDRPSEGREDAGAGASARVHFSNDRAGAGTLKLLQ